MSAQAAPAGLEHRAAAGPTPHPGANHQPRAAASTTPRPSDDHRHGAGARSAPARPASTLAAAGDLLRALAAPVRIAIVLELRESPHCVHDLVDTLGVTQPLVSQHLRVLKSAGVVAGERHGREVVYRLVDEHLAHIVLDAVTHAEETAEPDRATPTGRVR